MLLHATDPKFGEPILGKKASQGCIRISNKLNEFLDKYAIIDMDYLQVHNNDNNKTKNKTKYSILRKDIIPVEAPGKYIVIY